MISRVKKLGTWYNGSIERRPEMVSLYDLFQSAISVKPGIHLRNVVIRIRLHTAQSQRMNLFIRSKWPSTFDERMRTNTNECRRMQTNAKEWQRFSDVSPAKGWRNYFNEGKGGGGNVELWIICTGFSVIYPLPYFPATSWVECPRTDRCNEKRASVPYWMNFKLNRCCYQELVLFTNEQTNCGDLYWAFLNLCA